MAFGVGELADDGVGCYLIGAEHPLPAEAFCLGERGINVGYLHIKRDVPLVAFGPLADATGDAGAFGILHALDAAVIHRVVSVHLPPEQRSVVALERRAILTHNLEMHDWLSHGCSSRCCGCPDNSILPPLTDRTRDSCGWGATTSADARPTCRTTPSKLGRVTAETSTASDAENLSYEAARNELADVVRRLEAGGGTLEESLALWERGEALVVICQEWLDGARRRLDAAASDAQPAR